MDAIRHTITVGPELDGNRLDKALAALVPSLGLRGRRRLIQDGRVSVNGVAQPAGYKVRTGERLGLEPDSLDGLDAAGILGLVRVARRDNGFAAIVKPAGLHTEALAGRDDASLELLLRGLFPDQAAVLVNRLDQPTSGLVVAALGPHGAERYRSWESEGQVEKAYLALVRGEMQEAAVIRAALDTASRKKTRVLGQDTPDALRWTAVTPLRGLAGRGGERWTLVRAVIRKGARHQIRAHLASIGHPIVGDALYGPPGSHGAPTRLRLHHARISFPGLTAEDPPDWPELEGNGEGEE